GSFARSNRIAQSTIQNRVNQTAEVYKELFQTINGDGGFRNSVSAVLSLADAFAGVVKNAGPLIPILATIGASKAFTGIAGLLPPAATGNRVPFSFRNPRMRLAGGALLAGSVIGAEALGQGGLAA